MHSVAGGAINQKMAIVMGGITKIFVGEIIETGILIQLRIYNLLPITAKSVMDEWTEQGPVRPRHIREAYRRLKVAGKIPYEKPQTKLFSR